MRNLCEYIFEKFRVDNNFNSSNIPSDGEVELPYTFNIYNEGPKNKDHKITKSIFYKLGRANNWKIVMCPKDADNIVYKKAPTVINTNNFKHAPELDDTIYLPLSFYNIKENVYEERWKDFIDTLKPYFKSGKVSVTIDKPKKTNTRYFIELTVNDNGFNRERDEKIEELTSSKALNELKKEWDEKCRKAKEDHDKRMSSIRDKMKNGTATDDELIDLYYDTTEELEQWEIAEKIKNPELHNRMLSDAKRRYYANGG